MSDSRTCQFCGGEIRFRMIQGVCVPLHAGSEQCITNGNSGRPDECHQTACPICGASIFFVRHNGGTVWFDDLGQPWDKHGCFAQMKFDTQPVARRDFLLMRIRKVLRCYLQVADETFPGFALYIGRNRLSPSVWEVYPEDETENPVLWKGRYCYLCAADSTLTFFNGKTFQLSKHD